jgi:8-oxo-dGTP pyrophosphatase MutT (NUDIX family)
MSEPFRNRRFQPVPPQERPRRRRTAARVVVTTGEDVLLLADTDPGIPGSRWWSTPGGGIDPGESPRAAAVRELAEETGKLVDPGALIGPVAVREVVHGYSDQILAQTEWFFVLVTGKFDIDATGRTEDELLTLAGHAWLPLAGLGALPDPVWPANLAELAALASVPRPSPVDLGRVEESTLAIDSRE